jgi:Protein of unknown function (DUF4254)
MSDTAGLGIPSAQASAALVRRVNHRWHELRPPLDWDAGVAALGDGGTSVDALTADLGLVNCFQWHLEDACRAAYHEPEKLAPIKREIDRSNARRVRLVDAIDRQIAARLRALRGNTGEPLARIALTLPGHLLDRLSILELKRYHLRSAGSDLAGLLDEQVDDLCQGIDELIGDLVAGTVRIKLYPTVKLYAGGS